MEGELRLGAVSLDCKDPHKLAEFYARLLQTEVTFDSDSFAAVQLDGVWLSFQKVEDYRAPTWPEGAIPQQMHLDFAVTDLASSEASALAAGAIKMEVQPSPERWLVFSDPAGHPFCLSSLIPG